MLASGYGQREASRAVTLLTKKDLKADAEVQLLEDVICLVFLQYYWKPFQEKHTGPESGISGKKGEDKQLGEEKLIHIVKQTWEKMSDKGRKEALKLDFEPRAKELILKALT